MARDNGPARKDEKIVEIPIAEEIASLNLNEATRANAGNPYFDEQLRENAPGWTKALFLIMSILVVGGLALELLYALLHPVV